MTWDEIQRHADATARALEWALAEQRIHGVDPQLFAVVIGILMQQAAPADLTRLRSQSVAKWAPMVHQEIASWDASVPTFTPPTERAPLTPDRTLPPPPAIERIASDPPPSALIPAPPPGMPPQVRESWIQARTRAGEYARGLGNVVRSAPNDILRERWDGEDRIETPDPEKRARSERILRESTADAVRNGWTPERLASEFGNRTGEWSRDWLRIAETELQAVNSEGAAIEAFRIDGPDGLMAVIPESDACDDCLRLCLDGGTPRVFTVAELAGNGTNVGKPREEWRVTIFPIHSRCKCGHQRVPPGYTVTRFGDLVPA